MEGWPENRPRIGFIETSWMVVSRIGAVLLFVGTFEDLRVGLAFVGVSILVAGDLIARAIRMRG